MAACLALVLIFATFFGGSEAPATPAAGRPRPGPSKPATEARAQAPGGFARKNPFEFVPRHPPPRPPPVAAQEPTGAARPPPQGPRSPLVFPWTLIGTITAGRSSMAFFQTNKDPAEMALGLEADLGEHLGGKYLGFRLAEVERFEVTFRRGAETLFAKVKDGAPSEPKPVPPTPSQSLPEPPPAPGGASEEAVRVLPEAEVKRALQNLAYHVTQVTVQPFFRDGRAAGVRLTRIRPNSFFAKLGIRNGDVVQSVDGSAIRDLRDTLKIHGALKNKKELSVEVLRGGQPRRLSYKIR